MINSKFSCTLLGVQHSLDSFPKPRQIILIEAEKRVIKPVDVNDFSMEEYFAKMMHDAYATFTVIFPEFGSKHNLDVDGIEDAANVTNVYVSEFIPWYQTWTEVFSEAIIKKESAQSATNQNPS